VPALSAFEEAESINQSINQSINRESYETEATLYFEEGVEKGGQRKNYYVPRSLPLVLLTALTTTSQRCIADEHENRFLSTAPRHPRGSAFFEGSQPSLICISDNL
jgi:hypothetical protein